MSDDRPLRIEGLSGLPSVDDLKRIETKAKVAQARQLLERTGILPKPKAKPKLKPNEIALGNQLVITTSRKPFRRV